MQKANETTANAIKTIFTASIFELYEQLEQLSYKLRLALFITANATNTTIPAKFNITDAL